MERLKLLTEGEGKGEVVVEIEFSGPSLRKIRAISSSQLLKETRNSHSIRPKSPP